VERSRNDELERGTVKYLVHAKLEVNGVVEPSDVVGAIFGQTEGLLGEELEMRELLRTGKIGRIKVNLSSSQGKTTGTILLPSGLDKMETCLLAAALETVDRIGPCEARITVERIEDVRASKREVVIKRAKELLREVESPETQELFRSLRESVHQAKIVEYAGLPAGPKVATSDSIIIVEGRADVLNLLRAGIENVIATEGASVPPAIVDLTKRKTTTVFVDSDRGGDLILKELLQVAEVDYIARPPPGKSVEELTAKEIYRALRNRVPASMFVREEIEEILKKLCEISTELRGSLKARLLKPSLEVIKEVQVREIKEELPKTEGVWAVVLDGVATDELVECASQGGVEYLICVKKDLSRPPPSNIKVLTPDELFKR
jgi:DNA primase